jgi:Fe-S cluster biogenesis protein NfuA
MVTSDSKTRAEGTIEDRVQQVMDMMRPAIQDDGGDVELVGITEEGVVQVRFHGACLTCPSSTMTLKSGLEANICHNVPEVHQVIAVK